MISYHFYALETLAPIHSIGNRSSVNSIPSHSKSSRSKRFERPSRLKHERPSMNSGVILPDDNTPGVPEFPLIYWNAAAALYAYAWAKLSRQGIDVVGHSQLVGTYLYWLLSLHALQDLRLLRLSRTVRVPISAAISQCRFAQLDDRRRNSKVLDNEAANWHRWHPERPGSRHTEHRCRWRKHL